MLLFIHGIRYDDPGARWQAALNAALLREGTEPLAARGYTVEAPSYLRDLETTSPPESDEPPMTYVKGPDDAYSRAAGAYFSAVADLERTGIRGHIREPAFGAGLPASSVAEAVMRSRFADAVAYRTSADRRHAIYRRVLRAIPEDAELVILAHSLGSIIAADLVYFLPRSCRLRMMVTLGSPLGLGPLHEHLGRRRNRFPFEVMGPWVNVVGTSDIVTAFRGLSAVFPEALDVFIDTGIDPRSSHAARAYLDHPTVARALHWLDDRHDRQPTPPDATRHVPDIRLSDGLLSVVVGSQYALRLEQAQGSGNQRARFAQARNLVLEDLTSRLRDAGHDHSVLHRLSLDNASLLRDRIPPAAAVNLLLSAWMMNPVMPYDIKLSEDVRHEALEKLALDVNVKSDWAVVISDAELKARAVHKAGLTWRRAAFAVAGAAALVAAPMLVVVAAPAGLAGGAAIVAGLAALGPGGMLGGLGIVGLIGGAGGAMAAQALVSGSAAQVEETVIYLQAFAKASHELDQAPAGYPSWTALVAMEDAVTDEHARVSRLSDSGAQMVKELEQKMRSIRRAIDWMVENSLSPVAILPPTSNS